MRGVVYGPFAFASSFFVLAVLLERAGILVASRAACLTAVLVQGATYAVLKRGSRAEPLMEEAA